MATEIEVVSTVADSYFSLKDLLRKVEDITSELAIGYNLVEQMVYFKRNGERVESETIVENPSAYYDIFTRDGEKLFSIWGPDHDVEGGIFTAEEKINDSPKFDSKLLPELVARAAEVNTSYTVRWSPTGNDLLVYTVCLGLSELISGVIVNQFGASVESGTYLVEDWRTLLRNEIGK